MEKEKRKSYETVKKTAAATAYRSKQEQAAATQQTIHVRFWKNQRKQSNK